MTIKAFISGCAGPALTAEEQSFFRAENPWGLILFKRNCETPQQLRELTASFREAVGRKNALVFVDQEGGRVQRLGPPSNSWRKYPSARNFSLLYAKAPLEALRAARNLGRLMAADLLEGGITANCLPVLDVPQPGTHDVIGDRAYSMKVEEIMALARAHTAGMMEGGVLPVMKHIPGHGRAMADSHLELPVVHAARVELEAFDFAPFAALADLPMAMTAHVVYSALDRKRPATLSRSIIRSVIRNQIGFQGLLITDDLSMKALSGSMAEKATAAIAAGCDMLLHCNGKLDEMREVAAAAPPLKGGAMSRARAALKQVRKPRRFDRVQAERDWEAVQNP
jgi:beta-N-acetylhexosaminidase